MRAIIPVLVLLAIATVAVPAAAQVPNLPAPPLPAVSQCLGSTTIVHVCAAVGHNIPKQADPLPPTIDPPAPPTCVITSDPTILGSIVACNGSIVINGRPNTYSLTLMRGLPLPALPPLPTL